MKKTDKNKSYISIIIISCLGILVYSNSFNCSFHYDDTKYIVDNFAIRSIQDLLNNWKFYPCRFITFLSITLNYQFNGLNVFGYHLFNLVIHLGTAILVWWLTLMTLSTPAMKDNKITAHANLIALFSGLVFVSHPLQTEAVTYIWQRTASMAALFYLTSLCLYIKSRLLQTNKIYSVPARTYYTLSLITAVVAMFTKESTVTLPLMILFYEFTFWGKPSILIWKRLIPFLLTLFIIPLTILLTHAVQFQEIKDFVAGPGGTSPLNYLLTQFSVLVTYIRLLILPLGQNIDYDYHISKSFFECPTLICFLFLSGILFFAKQLFAKYRLISFSIIWFFLTLSLESSLFPLKNVIYEHRLYLPMAGYSIFLVSAMYYLLGKGSIKTMAVVLMMIITFNSILTFQRNTVWANEFTLWDDAARKSPHKARPYNNRGLAYVDQGNFFQAQSDFSKAIALLPTYEDAYINRGNIYSLTNDLRQALSDYNSAVEIEPYNVTAYINRGIFYDKHGDLTEALSDYNKAIALDPKLAQIYNNRACLYVRQNNYTQAISDFSKAIETNPGYAGAYYNRAIAYYKLKEYDNALINMQKSAELGKKVDPNFINELQKVSGHDQ